MSTSAERTALVAGENRTVYIERWLWALAGLQLCRRARGGVLEGLALQAPRGLLAFLFTIIHLSISASGQPPPDGFKSMVKPCGGKPL